MPVTFNPSTDFTVGVELEFQLLDERSLALANASNEIISSFAGDDWFSARVKHELMISNIEVITGVCRTVDEAGVDLRKTVSGLIERARDKGVLICGAGTHPFSLYKDQQVTDDPRYQRILKVLQFVARRFNIFGMHIHVGIDGGEKCIYVLDRMLYYLPYILAFSANSPYWEGVDTGLMSYRTKVFETLPTAGLPFYFDDWAAYTRLVESYIATETIESIREIWWDARPHPDFGTIEVRVCDTPSTIGEALAIAAFVQALVKRFSDDFDRGAVFPRPPSSVIRENKWRACRYGMDASLISTDGRSTVNLRETARDLCRSLRAEARELGSEEQLKGVEDIINGGGAERQLRFMSENSGYEDLLKHLVGMLEREVLGPDGRQA